MRKLNIYRREENGSNTLLRTIVVRADFIGIGRNGQINDLEFKRLALDLEPEATSHQIIN